MVSICRVPIAGLDEHLDSKLLSVVPHQGVLVHLAIDFLRDMGVVESYDLSYRY